jgi:hypothetical protein
VVFTGLQRAGCGYLSGFGGSILLRVPGNPVLPGFFYKKNLKI